MPDWYLRVSAASGPAFVSAWTNADVAAVAFVVFAIFFALGTAIAASWPSDLAFLSLVAGGVMVAWPAMVALALAAVMLAVIVSIVHSIVAPERSARIAAEAQAQVSPAIAEFARDMRLSEAERKRTLGEDERGQRPP
jgi:hypothetical protein